HGRRFRIRQPPQLGEHFGDYAGRRYIRHAAEQYGRQRLPAEQESSDDARREIEDEIEDARRKSSAKIPLQLFAGIFETKHEQKEKHANLGSNVDEVLGQI